MFFPNTHLDEVENLVSLEDELITRLRPQVT